jgi:hypothetical protein
MSLSSFPVSEPAIGQMAEQAQSKTPPKRRTQAVADATAVPEPR